MQQNIDADNEGLPSLVPISVQEQPLVENQDPHFRRTLNNLILELLDAPGAQLCSLCTTSNGGECVWNQVAIDIILAGETAIEMYDAIHDTSDMAAKHSAARYACYQKYIFTASSWTPGQGRICLPACVEARIKLHYPGNRRFVGFREL